MGTIKHVVGSLILGIFVGMCGNQVRAENITSGEWVYDGNSIVKYLGDSPNCIVPSAIDGVQIESIASGTFDDAADIRNLLVSEGIIVIEDNACSGIADLRSLSLPASMETVGSAFSKAVPIIRIPSITDWLQINFTGRITENTDLYVSDILFTSFNAQESQVTALNEHAFYGIRSLRSADLNGITDIPRMAFKDCISLGEVVLDAGTLSIGQAAFDNCDINEISIPDNVRELEINVLRNNRNLKEVVLGSGIAIIGDGAFDQDYAITAVFATSDSPAQYTGDGFPFPEIVRENACLYVPSGKEQDYSAWGFSEISAISEQTEWQHSGGTITGYTGTSIDPVIPEFIGTEKITAIGQEAFKGNTDISSIVLPASVTDIGKGAFSGCTNLGKITINGALTMVAEETFKGCTALKSIQLPDEVETIEAYAFQNSGLVEFTVPPSLKVSQQAAFENTGIKTIDCPSLSIWLGIRFENETANPACAGARLFLNAKEATEINSVDVSIIGEYQFYNVKSIKQADLKGVTMVLPMAFKGCSNLSSVTFDRNLTEVHFESFSGTAISGDLVFGDALSSIAYRAFDAESNGGITSLSFGSNLVLIGANAFAGHDNITAISCKGIVPAEIPTPRSVDWSHPFSENVVNNALLTVPEGSRSIYAKYWGFKNIETTEAPTLTIAIPEGGNMSIVSPNDLFRIRLYPSSDEWVLHSAMLGDEDITDQIDSEGYYLIYYIDEDTTLSAVFKKKDDNGVDGVQADSTLKVTLSDGIVKVSGASDNAQIRVYDISGHILKVTGEKTFTIDAHGVMILTVDGQSFKFMN